MDLMAEHGRCYTFKLELDFARLESTVALGAISGGGKDILTIVTGAARLAFGHVCHGRFADNRFIGENLGVAVTALVGGRVNCVAESGGTDSLEGEDYVLRLDDPFVTALAVGGYGKCLLAVMAGTAGFTLFHLIHGDRFTFAGNYLAVVAALTASAGFGNVD